MKYLLMHAVDETVEYGPEEQARLDSALTSWLEEAHRRDARRHGSRLRPVGDATSVRVRDGDVLVADGPFAETKEQIGGFDVIECAELDEAIDLASRHPCALIGTVEVRPFWAE